MAALNSTYKSKHKPLKEGQSHYHQGYYTPTRHPEKCLSLGQNIYRSSWEMKFFDWCDRCDSVVRWAAEPISIPYLSPTANFDYCIKNHLDPKNSLFWKKQNYNVDVWIELSKKDGSGVRKIFIEIKPYAQTIQPVPPKPDAKLKEFKAYNRDAMTYLTNQAKWEAATKYFKERGCEFIVVTEHTLKKLGIL